MPEDGLDYRVIHSKPVEVCSEAASESMPAVPLRQRLVTLKNVSFRLVLLFLHTSPHPKDLVPSCYSVFGISSQRRKETRYLKPRLAPEVDVVRGAFLEVASASRSVWEMPF